MWTFTANKPISITVSFEQFDSDCVCPSSAFMLTIFCGVDLFDMKFTSSNSIQLFVRYPMCIVPVQWIFELLFSVLAIKSMFFALNSFALVCFWKLSLMPLRNSSIANLYVIKMRKPTMKTFAAKMPILIATSFKRFGSRWVGCPSTGGSWALIYGSHVSNLI